MGQLLIVLATKASVAGQDRSATFPTSASSNETLAIGPGYNLLEEPVLLQTLEGHTIDVNAASFSPDGIAVFTGSDDKTAHNWDAATGESLQTLKTHTDFVRAASFPPDGKTVLTASSDYMARL